MKLLALFSLALVASSVSAAPLEKRNSATCASTLSGMSTMTCNCLSSCTQADTCCPDYEEFNSRFMSFVEPHGIAPPAVELPRVISGRVPQFHKQAPAITAATSGPNGSTLLTVRHCVFHDQLQVEPARPGNSGTTVMPKWIVKECTPGYDVIALTRAGTFGAFTSAVNVPKSVRVALGSLPPTSSTSPLDSNMYFAQLAGASAAAAYKMALTAERPVAGFTGKLARTRAAGKLAFDSTPGRMWRVESAALSTTNVHEMAAPEVDVTAGMLDAEYDRVAAAANYQVAPVRGGVLRMVFDERNKVWVEVVDGEGRRVVAQSLGA